MINYNLLKKIMFMFQPEVIHDITIFILKLLPYCKKINGYFIKKNFVHNEMLTQKIFNKTFHNPIGLAAGFDKNAAIVNSTLTLGFGYTEVGTVTPKAQSGNKKPRLFRYTQEKSLQNSMGFNNKGIKQVNKNLKKIYPFVTPIGISIGKNKETADDKSINDYETLLKSINEYCDYIAINISSPNTPNLRDLQNEEFIKTIFNISSKMQTKPILLKISPDIENETAVNLCKVAIKHGASGIIASNTTQDYSLLENCKNFGGISGAVANKKYTKFFKYIGRALHDKTILISVGGIECANDVYERIKAGASLVQIYTALIYEGPSMCKNINEELIKLLKQDGFQNIKQAIGKDYK